MHHYVENKPSPGLLTSIITQRINTDGPISFNDFMEMTLYYPELGYYTSPQNKIGIDGDYYTSPGFTPVFGEMIAKQLEEMWHMLGGKEFAVVEYGAGTGSLCLDILNQLKNNEELYNRLTYYIIEKSPAMREKEKRILHEKVKWYNSIGDIPEVCGCILSNEVLDNFSVHQVVMEEDLMEVFVDYNKGFVELLKPAPKALKDYLSELNVMLPKGYRTEINLQAIEWIKEIASALKKGFVLTIDYGYPSNELYSERRSSGTIVCYNKHSINTQPYANIGEQDITAHVNFSALNHWGIKNGLECCGYTNQAHFLLSLGIENHIRKMEENMKNGLINDQRKVAFLYTLLVDMGCKFKVLIQQKGMQQERLKGLRFQQKSGYRL